MKNDILLIALLYIEGKFMKKKHILLRRKSTEYLIGEEKDPVYRKHGDKKPFFISSSTKSTVKLSEELVLKALEAHGGLITHAARSLHCSYRKLKRFIGKNPSIEKTLKTYRLINVERAERKLRDLVEAGNLGAICFTLKCQGRDRGWVENLDVTIPDRPITFKYVLVERNKDSNKTLSGKSKDN